MMDMDVLNAEQKKAVLDPHRFLRIVAGAGSGKTRVLTMRIAHLVEDMHVPAYKILAITFTNKAANEMKERLRKLLRDGKEQPWISTIHSLCVRILREDIQSMGWPRNFTVLDGDDQKSILRAAYKELGLSSSAISYASAQDYIANCKYADVTPEQAAGLAGGSLDEADKVKIYAYYLQRQNALYALDFDDLILWTVRMFHRFPDIVEKWRRRFGYIHVDEFQDIDMKQYELIRQLTGETNSLYVVGDPDQTIYTWRGADVNIILNFKRDFPQAETIMLNQNYRSTSYILKGANAVIRNNRDRLEKELFTTRAGEVKIVHHTSVSDSLEAEWVAEQILAEHQAGKAYKDMAVLYRSNYLSRSLEKGLLDARIPYIIYGGIRFYERQEIKDALCYLRMASGADDLALQRIINKPRRGIGEKSMDRLVQQARKENRTLYEVLRDETLFTGKIQKEVERFVAMTEHWRKLVREKETPLETLFTTIMEESGYQKELQDNHEQDRLENLKELLDDMQDFAKNNPESTLEEYLQLAALYGDREEVLSQDYVQLMTVHAAKGLEFDTVFVTDMNEGIFPNERALNDSAKGLEEERRLAYVAFTRARNKLFITDAGGFSFILQRVRTPSRFIEEIDEDCIVHEGRKPEVPLSPWTNAFITDMTESAEPALSLLHKGDTVLHAKFGEGIVLSCQEDIATIAFAYPYGIKKIAVNHPTLTRIREQKS